MLTAIACVLILTIVVLLCSGKVSPVPAFALLPVVAALVAGFTVTQIGDFISAGLKDVVSVVTLFVFAILFFRVVELAGLFEPLVNRTVKWIGEDIVRLTVGTALLVTLVHFIDGSAAVTILITVPPLLPVYQRLGVRPVVLTLLVGLAYGVTNMTPWHGPVIRAGAALETSPMDLWLAVIPVQIVGNIAVIVVAYILGRRERTRLHLLHGPGGSDIVETRVPADAPGAAKDPATVGPTPSARVASDGELVPDSDGGVAVAVEADPDLRRPKLFWVNAILTLIVLGVAIWAVIPMAWLFMAGFAVAIMINYPNAALQMELIQKHAGAPVLMASIILSAGVFLGIGSESGMFDAVADTIATGVPAESAAWLPFLVALFGVPLTAIFPGDVYYLGILPIFGAYLEQAGIPAATIAHASMINVDTTGSAISPFTEPLYLLVGLCGVSLAKHIKTSFLWFWGVGVIIFVAALVFGVVPLPF